MLENESCESPELSLKKDIYSFLRTLNIRYGLVVLTGDTHFTENHMFVKDLFLKHVLIDAMQVHNPDAPRTRTPGKKTIDFIMTSKELETRIAP